MNPSISINMCEIEQHWDLDFFRTYIPTLIAQSQKIDSTFEIFVRAISELHHRLTSIMVGEPYRFRIKSVEAVYQKIRYWISGRLQENKSQLRDIGGMLSQFKGAVVQLKNYYYDCQSKGRDIAQRKEKIQKQFQGLGLQLQSLVKIAEHRNHQCRYLAYDPTLSVTAIAQQNQQFFLRQKLQYMKIEVDQLKAKQQIYILQQNNRMRMSLAKINGCFEKINRYKAQADSKQQFGTFNRDGNIIFQNNQPQDEQRQHQSENPKVSQFKFKKEEINQINQIIRQAEDICEKQAYEKINERKAQIILQAAILAQSKEEIDFGQNRIKRRFNNNVNDDPSRPPQHF